MSRLEWILGIVLVVLLGVVIVLSLIFWFQPKAPAASSVAGQSALAATITTQRGAVAPTSVYQGQTAHLAFAAAQRTATSQQADAVLVDATATWPQVADAQTIRTGEASWAFTFYSAAASTVTLISVAGDQARVVSQAGASDLLQPLDAGGWKLDSRDAIQQFLDEGGAAYMETAGLAKLVMRLNTGSPDGRIEWLVSLFAPQSGGSFTMRIDATSGEVLSVDQV